MKKFVSYLMPLFAISFLASCNNSEKKVSTLPIKCNYYQRLSEGIILISEEQYEYNDKNLLTKSVNKFKAADLTESHEYEYDDKNNMTKNTYIYKSEESVHTICTNFAYTYDQKNRILKKVESRDGMDDIIDEYTYESDLMDWNTHKHSEDSGATYYNIVTRTFEDGLYKKAVDSKRNKYYYYTWDEYKCNTKIETYNAEEKTPANHYSDEIYEYHKNMPNKIEKYVLSYYEGGEVESNETTQTEYDKYDRKIKISNYNEQVLNSYTTYEYAD